MKNYLTEQRRSVVNFLSANSDRQFTVDELTDAMTCDEALLVRPAKSTVYRIIRSLVADGTVKRFVRGQSRQFIYQIAGCKNHGSHLHMKCTVCGRLFHMKTELSDILCADIAKDSGFSIDEEKTTLFGVCGECGDNE